MFVIYSKKGEVLVTTKKKEKTMVESYFNQGGRDIADYDRDEIKDYVVEIQFSWC